MNNAGIEGKWVPITELPEEEWDRVLDTNLKGVYVCLQHEARAMLAGGNGGAIVNIGAVNSFLGFPTGSAYVASKHALIGLTSSVSAELAPQGIRVNVVCPGFIDTPMHRRARGVLGDDNFVNEVCTDAHSGKKHNEPKEFRKIQKRDDPRSDKNHFQGHQKFVRGRRWKRSHAPRVTSSRKQETQLRIAIISGK